MLFATHTHQPNSLRNRMKKKTNAKGQTSDSYSEQKHTISGTSEWTKKSCGEFCISQFYGVKWEKRDIVKRNQ